MRSTKRLMTAAALVAGMGIAQASVYSNTTALSGNDLDNSQINFTTSAFNPSLGTLDAVSLTFQGSYATTLSDGPSYLPANEAVIFHNSIGVSAPGIEYAYGNNYQLLPNSYGTENGAARNVVGQTSLISATFNVAPAGLHTYLSGYIHGNFGLVGATYSPTTGQFLGLDMQDSNSVFSGNLIETFTYTAAADPTNVPEPGSLALLGTAVVMLAGAARVRRRRPRS